MKTTTIISIAISGLAAVLITSCGTSDPEYKAWKEQQSAQSANNPYGVPQTGGESGTYTPSGTAPYQPLPGVNPPPTPQPPLASDVPAPAVPAGPTTPHKVVAGDSLWALAKKYNTNVEAIQAANGMSDTNIRAGQTLNIPGNQ
jgi:LysM repeat protein